MTQPDRRIAAGPGRPARGKRALVGIVATAFVGVVAVAGIIGVAQGRINLPLSAPHSSEATGRPVPSSEAPPVPVTAIAGPNPQACVELYSTTMWNQLSQRVLNAPEAPLPVGTADPELAAFLTATPGLNCAYGTDPRRALTTTVVRITDAQEGTAMARLGTLGAQCAAYEGGQRCLLQGSGDHGVTGETHVFREGVWIASAWTRSSPTGYTAAIVASLFPA